MSDGVYVFGNGLRVHRADLLDIQVERYAAAGNPNLHEPVEEEWMLRSFAVDTPPEPIFLDIGAGIGYYSMLIKSRWPAARVLAVDALPRHVAALRANLGLNGLADDSVEVIDEAVGETDGVADFVDVGYGSALAQSVPPARRADCSTIRVRMRSLGALLAELPPVHLMKIDIQGAELAALTPARELLTAGRVAHMLVGTHGPELHAGVRSLLEACGFAIVLDDPAPAMQPDGIVLGRHV